MTPTFKKRPITVPAIEVVSPITQASDIATFLGAQSVQIDIGSGTATFTKTSSGDGSTQQVFTLSAGQVVSINDGVISIQGREAFFAEYEQVPPSFD